MGRYVIKAARDRDLYMEWSEHVDAPTFVGTRAQTLDYLIEEFGRTGQPEARLQRADDIGTSAIRDPLSPNWKYPLTGAWEDTGFIVQQRGWLPRDRFAEFLDAFLVDEEKAYALLDPLDD